MNANSVRRLRVQQDVCFDLSKIPAKTDVRHSRRRYQQFRRTNREARLNYMRIEDLGQEAGDSASTGATLNTICVH